MPHADVLRTLVEELNRVGVDAEHMVAGLSARADDAIRALRSLPDGAGPAAFLARLRYESDTLQRADAIIQAEVARHADSAPPGDERTPGRDAALAGDTSLDGDHRPSMNRSA
jgi:hypothetical protein